MLLLDGAELGHVVGVYVGLLLGFGVPLLNDEQLVRVGGAQVVIVALKTVLLLAFARMPAAATSCRKASRWPGSIR